MAPTASPKGSGSQKSDAGAKKKSAAPAGGDLRNYFGGGGAKKPAPAPTPKAKGNAADPLTIDESSDEEMAVKKPTARKPPPPKSRPTTSKHFSSTSASSSKRPISVDSSPEPETKPKPTPVKTEAKPSVSPAKPRASSRASSSKPTPKPAPKRKTPLSSDEEDEKPARPAKRAARASADSDYEDEKPVVKKTPVKAAAKPAFKGKKRVVKSESEQSESEEEVKPQAKARKAPAKSASKDKKLGIKPATKASSSKADADDEDKPKKPNFAAVMAARAAGPRAPGSKDIPVGKPGALAGLTLVFTGELESLGRDDAIDLAKRYLARVTGAPSGKTDYVIVGEGAGPSKLKKIEEAGTKTLDEDGFLNLIATRTGVLDAKQKEAIRKEEQKIIEQAKELERREKEEERARKKQEAVNAASGVAAKKTTPASAQLWTTKYAPQTLKEVCGNKTPIEKLKDWLFNWQKNYKSGFKKPGKDGSGLYRAVLISGPPGIGKTTSAHLMAKEAGYSPLELNASDARSKKLIENSTNIDNTSLDGFFHGKSVTSTTVADAKINSRTCLIMDEVDGMSAGDRGGVGALNALIKKTKIPMILICNDRSLPKMKPLWTTTFNLPYRRPGPNEIRSRIMTILHREKLKIPANVVDELVKGANSDIRQVLNMLSTYKLGKSEMNFDEGKELIKVNEKNTILTPFTIIDRLTGPYAFSRTNKETLGDKMELFFHDIAFVPLFMQEHYPKTNPAALNNLDGPEKQLKNLELLSKAADAVSDGDLVDRMIHGTEQHWSLLPFHAVTSAVIPAYHVYGTSRSTPGGGWGGPAFPQWLGQNSKQNKLGRQLTDIQIRMRLCASGGRDEIRQQYMPLLASKIVLPLMDDGASAIEETIQVMDDYYLGKEDWDAFVELGVDTMKDELILKKIASATKAAFTRQYNKTDHPIAFHKGDMFAASRKKIVDTGPAPDNEEVFEEDEVPPDDEEEDVKDEGDVNDYTKDKLIKEVKPKGKAKAKPKAKK